MKRLGRLVLAMLLAATASSGAAGVDYIRLTEAEFNEDLVRAARMAQEERYREARVLLKVMVDERPDDADALSLMGYVLRKSGDQEAAEEFYLRALAIEPTHPGANQYVGELYVELGELGKAEHHLGVLEASCSADCPGRSELEAAIAAAR